MRFILPFAKVSTSRAEGICISLKISEDAANSGFTDMESPNSSFMKPISVEY